MVDISKIKPGDEVLVRMTAANDYRNGGADYRGIRYLVCEDPYEDPSAPELDRPFVVLATNIVSHTPKALTVGDRVVRKGDNPRIWEVTAAARPTTHNGTEVCIWSDDIGFLGVSPDELERVDA